MKRTRILLLALAIGASSNLVAAQRGKAPGGGPPTGAPGNPDGAGGHRHQRSPIIEALDLDGDGVIDAGEIAKAPQSLRKLDKNGDGKLTEDEYRSKPPGDRGGPDGGPKGRGPGAGGKGGPDQDGPGGRQPRSFIGEALDLNKDGVIDAGEIAKASQSLRKLDKNGDGKLTEDEYRQKPPGGPGDRPVADAEKAQPEKVQPKKPAEPVAKILKPAAKPTVEPPPVPQQKFDFLNLDGKTAPAAK